MTGSVKQIAWAEDIKADFLRSCEEVKAWYDAKIEKERSCSDPDEEEIECLGEYVAEAEELMSYFADRQNAAFWIDHRNEFMKDDKYTRGIERIHRFKTMKDLHTRSPKLYYPSMD